MVVKSYAPSLCGKLWSLIWPLSSDSLGVLGTGASVDKSPGGRSWANLGGNKYVGGSTSVLWPPTR